MRRYIDIQDPIYGETALHKAVRHRRFQSFRTLCKYGPDANLTDNNKETAAHMAACYQDVLLWTYLLRIGTDTSITNNQGFTVAQKALRNKNHIASPLLDLHKERLNAHASYMATANWQETLRLTASYPVL